MDIFGKYFSVREVILSMHEDKSFLFIVPNLIFWGKFKGSLIVLTFSNGLQKIPIASQAIQYNKYLNIGIWGIELP